MFPTVSIHLNLKTSCWYLLSFSSKSLTPYFTARLHSWLAPLCHRALWVQMFFSCSKMQDIWQMCLCSRDLAWVRSQGPLLLVLTRPLFMFVFVCMCYPWLETRHTCLCGEHQAFCQPPGQPPQTPPPPAHTPKPLKFPIPLLHVSGAAWARQAHPQESNRTSLQRSPGGSHKSPVQSSTLCLSGAEWSWVEDKERAMKPRRHRKTMREALVPISVCLSARLRCSQVQQGCLQSFCILSTLWAGWDMPTLLVCSVKCILVRGRWWTILVLEFAILNVKIKSTKTRILLNISKVVVHLVSFTIITL